MTLKQLSRSLFLLRDTCNVYVIKRGRHALLVDFGSGAVLGQLPSLGVEKVSALLVTHHHRDQVQGLERAHQAGIPIFVPLMEEELFSSVDAHWQARELANSYNNRQDRFSLLEPVPVTGTLADHAVFAFEDLRLEVLPTPGHTVGSISLLVELDGRRLAFTGDLLAGAGRVWSLAATQWTYNGGEGLGASITSLLDVRDREPAWLLPSHGDPMKQPRPAVDLTVERLRRLLELRREDGDLDDWRESPYEEITPHLLRNRTSIASSYVLLSEGGHALLIDYGYDFTTGLAAGSDRASRRPSLATIPALKRRHGVTHVDAVVLTHYHDDHVAGCNLLRQVEGAEVWASESFVDVLERPQDHDLPCLWYDPVQVDRSLPLGSAIRWREHELTLYRQPGHTLHAVAIAFNVDGERVLVGGDQYSDDGLGLNYVYANGFRAGDYTESALLYRELDPTLLLFGHRPPLRPEPGYFDRLLSRGAELELLHRELLAPDELDLESSGPLLRLRPYRVSAAPGEVLSISFEVRNPEPREQPAAISLALPEGWTAEPEVARLELPPRSSAVGAFRVTTAGPRARRRRLAADVRIGSRHLGQIAEALVTIR